jgi:hypothetical protein
VRSTLAVALLCASLGLRASAQETFSPTQQFGTGLINAPVAWISPQTADFWIDYSGMRIPSTTKSLSFAHGWNGNGAIETQWLGRFSLGFSLYSNNPEYGFFGQLLALKDGQFSPLLPAIAVGFRNLGPFDHEDRFLIGHDVMIDTVGNTHGFTPSYFKHLHTAPTVYIAATKSINFTPLFSASFTLGGGQGLFSDDGGLGAAYDRHGQVVKGMFFGTQLQVHPTSVASISLVAENDAWNYNVGLRGEFHGIGIGLYGTELEEGSTKRSSDFLIYNYAKANFVVYYHANFRDVGRGIFLRSEITQLEHQQSELKAEMARRERRIHDLQVSLGKLQGSALSDVERQRQELEAQLKEEQDQIRRANERLQQLQGGKPQ